MSDSDVEVTSPKQAKLTAASSPSASAAAASAAVAEVDGAVESMEGEEVTAAATASPDATIAPASSAAAKMALLQSHHISLVPSFSSASFEYADRASINQFLICALCSNPLYQPLEHTKCRMAYCSACLTGGSADGEESMVPAQCPECKEAIIVGQNTSDPSKIVMLQLDALKVQCRACEAQLTRGQYEQHWRQDCPVPCPFGVAAAKGVAASGCTAKLSRANLNAHIDICNFAPVQCDAQIFGCTWQGQREALRAHTSSCSYVVCTSAFQRQAHIISAQEAEIAKLRIALSTREGQLQSYRDRYDANGPFRVGTIVDARDTEDQ